jgi:hypothetical protein
VLGNLAIGLAARRARRLKASFLEATKEPWRQQEKLLRELLRRDAKTEYGRRFGFSSISSAEDFRRRVPLVTYEDLASSVERMFHGEKDVLVSRRDPLVHFCLTSGTTGRPKTIPITASFLKAYKQSWAIWAWSAVEAHPALYRELSSRRLLALVSPAVSGTTPSGCPQGAITGLTTHAQARVLGRILAAPQACSLIEDFDLRLYAFLRFGLLHEVGHISTPNPSTLLRLAELLAQSTEELLRDIRDGTLKGLDEMPPQAQRALSRHLRPERERARLLERRAGTSGALKPREAWPNLELISCWTGGTLRLYLERLPHAYGEVALRDLGLIASEGRMSLPLSDGGEGVLDLWSHVFEFIPEAEAESPSPETLWLNELQTGGRYFLVLTNRSGLYRYQIQDCVEVVGRLNATPLIVFLHKGRSISSLTGEKLTETQIIEAAEKVLSSLEPPPERFTLCPCWAEPPRYALCLEREPRLEQSCSGWLEAFDEALKELNMEYASKRRSGRLGPIEAHWLEPGTFARLEQERIARAGGRAEQVKHPHLVPDLDFLERLSQFQGLEKDSQAET